MNQLVFIMKARFSNWKNRSILRTALVIFIMTGLNASPSSQIEKGHESELKATFIYNFTRYIRWPNLDGYESFNIGILGDSRVMEPLQEIAKKKTVHNKKMMIKHLNNTEDIHDCQIVFISESMRNEAAEILNEISEKHILTIGESEGMARQGIAMNFIIQKDRIKFEMNIRAFQRAGLAVSSQLQKLAIMVEEEI